LLVWGSDIKKENLNKMELNIFGYYITEKSKAIEKFEKFLGILEEVIEKFDGKPLSFYADIYHGALDRMMYCTDASKGVVVIKPIRNSLKKGYGLRSIEEFVNKTELLVELKQ